MDGVENDGLDVETEKEDYRNLMEKLQNFENLFAKASMESVIYQLAKVLFYQSFSISKLIFLICFSIYFKLDILF